jgi:hypothetical protein
MAIRCGVGIQEFWELTPYEIYLYAMAKTRDIEESRILLAWHAANLMNCWRGKNSAPVTVAKLIGKRTIDPGNYNNAEELRARLDKERDR